MSAFGIGVSLSDVMYSTAPSFQSPHLSTNTAPKQMLRWVRWPSCKNETTFNNCITPQPIVNSDFVSNVSIDVNGVTGSVKRYRWVSDSNVSINFKIPGCRNVRSRLIAFLAALV